MCDPVSDTLLSVSAAAFCGEGAAENVGEGMEDDGEEDDDDCSGEDKGGEDEEGGHRRKFPLRGDCVVDLSDVNAVKHRYVPLSSVVTRFFLFFVNSL
jgi:hypothetical protein